MNASSARPPKRHPWQEIAERIVNESDPQKLVDLCDQLTRALDDYRKSNGRADKPPDAA